MSIDDRDTLDKIIDLLDNLLDSDSFDSYDWDMLNDAYHKLESVRDND